MRIALCVAILSTLVSCVSGQISSDYIRSQGGLKSYKESNEERPDYITKPMLSTKICVVSFIIGIISLLVWLSTLI